jgi:hypothetical protein
VRIAVYQVARSLGSAGSAGVLRERLAAEEDASARVELVRALGTAGSAGMLAELLEQGHEQAVFAVAWSLLAAGPDRPEAVVDHLVRLWPTQAKAYPVAGGDDPVGALAREAGIHAVPVLFRLAQETGTPVGDLAWAWHDLVRSRRDALEPALVALLALTERGEDVEDLLGTLLPMLPVAGSGRAQAGDRLVRLVERAGPATPETQAALAVALFGLRDPRWLVPALAATAAEHPPYVTVGGTSLEFAAALGEFGPFGSAESDLVDVALAAITAWPGTVDGWAGLLAGPTLSPGSGRRVVEALLADGIGGAGAITSKAVTRLLARIAGVPAAFDAAALQAVRELPVPGGEAGAWLLVTRARLDPGDPGAFARAWRMGEMGEGEDELLRIWAGHPSPELELVCQDLVARTNWGAFRSRAVQVVAMEVLTGPALAVGPAPAGRIESVWPVLVSLLGVAGDVRADAVALGNRLVGVRPDLRPEWIARLRNLAESNDFVTLIALDALQRLGGISPDQALDRALTGVNVVAGTRRAAAGARVAARVIREALADRPDLRPVAMAGLARLIEGAERVVAPAEIATDTGLVRNLREACAG